MLFTDVLLGISLAIDAFVASLAIGLKQPNKLGWRWLVAIPLTFGVFQFAMPLFGWQLMNVLSHNWIEASGRWLAFILLVGVGGNMIRNVFKAGSADVIDSRLSIGIILSLAVATSIDALAVGFTIPAVSTHPLLTISVIGLITTALCWLAFIGTSYIPKTIARPAEIGAGLVLIGLGCKLLFL